MTANIKFFTITQISEQPSLRLDHIIMHYWQAQDFSRAQIIQLIKDGQVSVNGTPITKASHKCKENDNIAINMPIYEQSADLWQQAQRITAHLHIYYEDDDIIVFEKPAGMVVHPGAGNHDDTLVHHLLAHTKGNLAKIGNDDLRPGIVHRLDKDTSGVMVAAKSNIAYHALTKIFAAHDLTRIYDCLVWGNPQPASGVIKLPIGRNPHNRKKMAVVSEGHGKNAITHYETQAYFGGFCAHVKCRLETGRTHQIRVHLSKKGHGIIGDESYGKGKAPLPNHNKRLKQDFSYLQLLHDLPRLALHASILEFTHPITQKPLSFESPLPDDIALVLNRLYGE